MSKNNYLLNNLDEPVRFLLFTIDEALALFLPLIVGMATNYLITGLIMSVVMFRLLKFLKKKAIGANLRQSAYWMFPTLKFFKCEIPSFIREFRG